MGALGGSNPENHLPSEHRKELSGLHESDEDVVNRVLAEHKPSRNPLVRGVWIVLGSLAVVFAVIGLVLPGCPTTPGRVGSAFFYALSSHLLFKWLLPIRLFRPVSL